ncbi:hypothetical protein PUNSTDRAFT_119808 [Punctularia strigosozonata HHB-11173 SS5]|uniref:uncharacterized protein n=1 Tax=Punctularia strigosozonata (strain HHB-11173) TaxID=741275 RepID=UPI0004417E44|nr:uncharacterized protein PUNSTDRAFT_119808 [Punctularia strigosozonata HHB-11173 SS5]EIN10983.1 hypothetical protein PUNSTDRAFT_119808 [Punctularia strigosozonata HHB-11173 SS5]
MSTTNMEEAATIAAEYISSLDNLPSEVQFLLTEMRIKDSRSQEILQEIQKESAKYIRHSLRGGEPSPKDAAIPEKIRHDYAEVDRLAAEKMALAERVVRLIARARARLDVDLTKVLALQGGDDPRQVMAHSDASAYRPNPVVAQMNKSLRDAFNDTSQESLPASPSASGSVYSLKRRKLTSGASAASIKLPSPAPPATGSATPTASRSRLAHQARGASQQRATQPARAAPGQTRRRQPVFTDEEDAEGEADDGADDAEGEQDEEDKNLYCFCQKQSYGEMIGCDSDTCHYQWFHLECVGLEKAPAEGESWFCSACVESGTATRSIQAASPAERGRKGRKGR